MADKWNLVFQQGATYEQRITVTGVPDIASAELWRIRVAQPNSPVFLNATTANGMIVDTVPPAVGVKVLIVPAATTLTFPVGNARFDFQVEWSAGTVVERYYGNGDAQVNPKVGT